MIHHIDDATVQLYLDGELEGPAAAAVEAHLGACSDCGARAERLAEVIADVAALPDSVDPPLDLWPSIAARIDDASREHGRGARALPGRREGAARRRMSIQTRGLVIAGWVTAVAAALLMGIGLGRLQRTPQLPTTAADIPEAAVGTLASHEQAEYDAAVEDLHAILNEMRGELQPETVAAVEESLRLIDQAIEEARAALAADPANEHLHRYLADRMQKKIRTLRAVTGIVTAQS